MIDNSASMAEKVAGKSISQYVKESLANAVNKLTPEDFVAIYYFDNNEGQNIELPPTSNKEKIKEAIEKMQSPQEMTNLFEASKKARSIFAEYDFNLKHLLIISDGEEAVKSLNNYESEKILLEEQGIECSTIVMGDYNPMIHMKLKTDNGKEYYLKPGNLETKQTYREKLTKYITSIFESAHHKKNQKKPDEKTSDNKPDDTKAKFRINVELDISTTFKLKSRSPKEEYTKTLQKLIEEKLNESSIGVVETGGKYTIKGNAKIVQTKAVIFMKEVVFVSFKCELTVKVKTSDEQIGKELKASTTAGKNDMRKAVDELFENLANSIASKIVRNVFK